MEGNQMTHTTEYRQPRFRAELQGETIGWYDTADEANAAIDAAIAQARKDETAETMVRP